MLIQERPITWLMVAVVALMALAIACNPETITKIAPTVAPLPTVTPVVPSEDPVLPTFEWDGPSWAVFLTGEVVVVGRCLYLGSDPQTRRLAVFAAGSVSWEGDTLVLSGQRFEIGERISAGGKEVPGIRNIRFLQEPHDSCDLRRVVLVFGAG